MATFGKPDPFEVNLSGGSLTTSINIDVPAGPKGFKPPLSLVYDSAGVSDQHSPQGAAPWVGEGWNMTMGAISWSEVNVNSAGTTAVWRDRWELSDAFGTSATLVPPTTSTAIWYEDSGSCCVTLPIQFHTTPETYAKVWVYSGGPILANTTWFAPCWRVFLRNGVIEEFGCTADSVQYYPGASTGMFPGQPYISSWLLDLIIEPDGNQIHVTYTEDIESSGGMTYPRDAVMGTVEWDSPSCSDANVGCSASGTAPHLWKPLMRVFFPAGHTVLYLGGATCSARGNLRCDDPVDLSGSGGVGAPIVQSGFVLNNIDVQISDDSSSSWHNLRTYSLYYEQSAPTTITDPITGLAESTSGRFLLDAIVTAGADGATFLPVTSFSYSQQLEYYEDSTQYPNPRTNCGPAWNTGYTPNPHGCVLWSRSYEGNSYYLATAVNGLGLSQSFNWVNNRDNTHGINGGSSSDPSDTGYCTRFQATGGTTYPCDMADDGTWSRISLGQRTNSLIRLTQAGQGGTQTSTPVTGTTVYVYSIPYPLPAQQCTDCVAGYSWGNQDDNDYLDFYNGKFMGFNIVALSNPDGSYESHHFYSTEGWGVYSTTQLTVPCRGAPTNTCHNDPWWDLTNAAHGHEYSVQRTDTDAATTLQVVITQYAAVCPPPWIPAGSPALNGYGNWSGNLVSPPSLENPVATCDIQTTQVDTKTYDGSSGSSVADQTSTYSFEAGTQPCTTCYGRLTYQTTTSNDGSANGSPTTIATRTAYIWYDHVVATTGTANLLTPGAATGPYLISFPAVSDTEDASGNRYQCTYGGYDQVVSGTTGSNSNLTRADLTRQDRYTSCGTAPNFTPAGQISTTYGFDNGSRPYGNPWWANDRDANAGNTSHLGCPVNGINHTRCTTFDGYFMALPTQQANGLNQISTTTYQAPANATVAGGFGIWPISSTDANGQITTYTYDALGRATSTTLPSETAGLTTQSAVYTYWCVEPGAQSPCVEIDQTQRLNSNTTVTNRSFFDGMGHLVETRSSSTSGDVVQYGSYDPSQHLVFKSVPYFVSAYTGPSGSAAYSIPDSTVAGTSYGYDALSRLLFDKDALSEQTTSAYAVVCAVPGTGDSACYERTLVLDALGHQTSRLTDALGRIEYEQRFIGNTSTTYALYATTKYTYDYLADLIQILHPDGVTKTTFQFDMAGRKTGMVDPDRGIESYANDQNGNLTQSTDARGTAGTIYVGYDGLDRPIWRNTSNTLVGAYDTYSYDSSASGNVGIGRLTGETFSGAPNNTLAGGASYIYDVRGQQTSQTLLVGSTSYPLGATYDDAGNVLTQTYPDGETVTNSYGSQGWLSQVGTSQGSTTLLSNNAYTGTGGAMGSITSANLGGSTYQYSAGFDLLGRDTELKLKRSSDQAVMFDQARTFDAAGNVRTANTTLPSGTDNQAFCYDEQNRLTWAGSTGTPPCTGTAISAGTLTSGQYTHTFSYDSMGRVTSGPLGAYTYGSSGHVHAATAIGSTYSAAYDLAGDMTCRAPSSTVSCSGTQTGAQLIYNNEGGLSNWQNQPSNPTSTIAFLYDGQGNRVAQQTTSSGSTTAAVYVGNVEEDSTTGTTTTKTTYYYANGMRFAMAVNGLFSYLAGDGLGSANLMLNATGSATGSVLFAPYGTVRYSSGSMPTSYGFTGQRADSASGLDYYGARYYDPTAGQFATADTRLPSTGLDVWGLARYAYVEGNPIVRTDPSGHVYAVDVGGCEQNGVACSVTPLSSITTTSSSSTSQSPTAAINGQSCCDPLAALNTLAADEHALWIGLLPTSSSPWDLMPGQAVCACSATSGDEISQGKDLKSLRKLSPSQLKQLQKYEDPEEIKSGVAGKNTGSTDIYRDPKTGDLYVGPKGGGGVGQPVGIRLMKDGTVDYAFPAPEPVPEPAPIRVPVEPEVIE